MTNTNILEGIRCPKCGYETMFNISVRCFAEVTDSGCETFGDNEWDENSECHCCAPDCEHTAKLKDFYIDNQGGDNAKT